MAEIIPFPERKPDQPTVLVVDDEYMMRGVLSEILQDSGFVVIAAESGEAAVHILSCQSHVDAVFSDIKMPGMDGFELAKWVHENRPDTPVILASGYTGKTNMAADLCGAEFLRKPYDFDLIIEHLRQTLARRAHRSA
jgi:two-component system, NtrC family, sensor kinase